MKGNEMERELYSIGQASKMCDVSPRMLRYYEEIGLIAPDYIAPESRYRYYAIETLRDVQTVRYLVDQGFALDEIKEALFDDDIDRMQDFFLKRIAQTKENIMREHRRLDSLKGWCGLIIEGREVLKHPVFAPTIRYFPEQNFFYYERVRQPQEQNSDVIIATEYFTASKRDGHSMIDVGGAFDLYYNNLEERMEGTYREHTLLQTLYQDSASMEHTKTFGDFNALCAYHIGSMDTIQRTYQRLLRWAQQHRFQLRGDSVERHVLDIYSTRDEKRFVTEIILPLVEDTDDARIASQW